MEQVATSRTQIPRVLKPIGNMVGLRERPKAMLTPDMKRTKTVASSRSQLPVAYPSIVQVPSERVIKELYRESCEAANENKTSDNIPYHDQQHLAPAGVLSFEEVLLPAIGLEEENALKGVQSKLQRDAPEYKFVMENCRGLVRESVRNAMISVQSSRSFRVQRQQERKHQQMLETKQAREKNQRMRKEEREYLARELTRKKKISRDENKRYLSRKNLRNQELWKEIVYLTSSIAQLEREERTWDEIEQDTKRLKSKQVLPRTDQHPSNSTHQQIAKHISSPSASGAISMIAPKCSLQYDTEEKVRDIILTTTRIQKGLGTILKLSKQSETLREELYSSYRKDHVFRGYQSVHNPKAMIRFLSQSQDDKV